MIVNASVRLSPTAAATAWKNTKGQRPMRTPVSPKVASSDAITTWQLATTPVPPPNAGPCTEAIRGFREPGSDSEQVLLKAANFFDVPADEFAEVHTRAKGVPPAGQQYRSDTAVFLSCIKRLQQIPAELGGKQIPPLGAVQPHTKYTAFLFRLEDAVHKGLIVQQCTLQPLLFLELSAGTTRLILSGQNRPDPTLNPIAVEKRNRSQAALTAPPNRAMHGSPGKFRLSFCDSSKKSPLAITLMAGWIGGWDSCRAVFMVMVEKRISLTDQLASK